MLAGRYTMQAYPSSVTPPPLRGRASASGTPPPPLRGRAGASASPIFAPPARLRPAGPLLARSVNAGWVYPQVGAHVKSHGLLRTQTVPTPSRAPTMVLLPRTETMPETAPPANESRFEESSTVIEGLDAWLQGLGLEAHLDDAVAWCKQNGAAFLEEVWENREELAQALGLAEDSVERERLLSAPELPATCEVARGKSPVAARAAGAEIQYPSTTGLARGATVSVIQQDAAGQQLLQTERTMSVPVTSEEAASAAMHMKRAYVPLRAWQQAHASVSRPARISAPSVVSISRPTSVDIHEPECPTLAGGDTDYLSHRQWKRDKTGYWVMWVMRDRITDPNVLHAMKQRIPSPRELNSLKEAQARLAASSSATATSATVPPDTLDGDNVTGGFRDLQQNFLATYGQRIRDELPGVSLQPAEVGSHVQSQFLSSCSDSEVRAAYHGTAEKNIPSILRQGLRVPGHGGVSVVHGSAHGVGVYTAKLGNAWLSKGFADSDNFLVCAVADEKAGTAKGTSKPDATPSGRTSKWQGSGPSGARFHRVHRKPVAASAQPGVNMLGNYQVTKETKSVRHVGAAMVVFDEARVTPMFVASGIGKFPTSVGQSYSHITALPAQPWRQSGAPRALPGGGYQIGTHQAKVGDERLWLPPEKEDNKKATDLRRRMEEKERDVNRRINRDVKNQQQQC